MRGGYAIPTCARDLTIKENVSKLKSSDHAKKIFEKVGNGNSKQTKVFAGKRSRRAGSRTGREEEAKEDRRAAYRHKYTSLRKR